jgi:hypothetical protein
MKNIGLVLLIIAICVFVFRVYGKAGIFYSILFFGITMAGKAILNFFGTVAGAVYWCSFIALISVIYIAQRRRHNQKIEHKRPEQNPD